MHGFEDVTLSWRGKDYVVPANRMLRVVSAVEHGLSFNPVTEQHDAAPLEILFRKPHCPHSRMAAALAGALRCAGANVSDEEVYLSTQHDLVYQPQSKRMAVQNATVMNLLFMLSPPAAAFISHGGKKESSEKKQTPKASSDNSTEQS